MNLSPDFLKFIAERSRDPMLEFSDQGILRQANRAAQRLFGWSEGERVFLHDLQLYISDQEVLTWEYLQQQKKPSILPIVVSYTLRAKKMLFFRLSVELSTYRTSSSYFLVLTPIPNKGVDFADYQLAEEKFYKAFHLSPDAISITRLSDGLFLEVNEGFVHISGYRREELIGETSIGMSFWPDSVARDQLVAQLQSQGEGFMEVQFQVKNGDLIDGQINARVIDIYGEPCLISVVRDLREQKAIERALQKSEKRLQVINRATNDAVWDWDLETDRLEWNEGIHAIFGYNQEEIEPYISWWEQKIHEEDRQRVVERIHRFVQQAQDRWFDKYRMARKDGSYAYVYDKGHIITNEQGKPVRMVGGIVDITDRVLAEESLMIRNRQIAEYSFFNSHKVRGPVSRLLGLVNLVQFDETSEEDRGKWLEEIKIAAEEIDEMIREITKIFY
uniref:histidine kinase n=1 Tax=Roseihalotalea indica TaxID=2867963 RepID=A0AA49GJ07_9BACT|nr:PAS domain S-box protein [Tunicatimonas sp. TK19036]